MIDATAYFRLGDPCPTDVLELLRKAQYSGNVLLEMPAVDEKLYKKFNAVLANLRGEWSRSAPRGHRFPYNPKPLIDTIIASGRMPKKNALAFFPTPLTAVDQMIDAADLVDSRAINALEPSAGTGAIARRLRDRFPSAHIQCVELDPWNCSLLEADGFTVDNANFLSWIAPQKYDVILMNPPFSGDGGGYVAHVQRAFSMLAPKGVLIAIVPAAILWNAGKDQFVQWIADNGDIIEALEADTFADGGTSVKTLIIKLEPGGSPWRYERSEGYPTFDTRILFTWLENERFWDRKVDAWTKDLVSGKADTDLFGDPGPKFRTMIESNLREQHRRYNKSHTLLGIRPQDWGDAVNIVIDDMKERAPYHKKATDHDQRHPKALPVHQQPPVPPAGRHPARLDSLECPPTAGWPSLLGRGLLPRRPLCRH